MKPILRIVNWIAILSMSCALAQAADLLSGTWKLNVAKSKSSPPELAPKSRTSRLEVTQGRVRAVIDGVDAKGRVTHTEYEAALDGKDYPWKGTIDGKPNHDTDSLSWRKIDDYTYEIVTKLKGKTLTTQRIVIARDGKTRTNTVIGKNAQGQTINDVGVWEKQ